MTAPAVFLGVQERPHGKPGVRLFNLTAPIPGHPAGSTVSAETLTKAGYELPPESECPECGGARGRHWGKPVPCQAVE